MKAWHLRIARRSEIGERLSDEMMTSNQMQSTIDTCYVVVYAGHRRRCSWLEASVPQLLIIYTYNI
jgi:hypothetical protein